MIRLAVRVRREQAEIVLAELLSLAPSGVEEVAIGSGSDAVVEYAVYGAPGELPALPDLTAACGEALVEVRTSEIADDWDRRWRSFHRPLVLGDRLAVRPPWESLVGTSIEIVIDPAQAFGTGAHATTRLCLELMLSLSAGGGFLDLGCGSGVLAIAAVALGWDPVVALDYDPASVQATGDNARVNGGPRSRCAGTTCGSTRWLSPRPWRPICCGRCCWRGASGSPVCRRRRCQSL